MKKVLKFFMYLVIIVIIAGVGYVAYLKFFAPKGSIDAFNTIPQDAVFIVETTNLSKAWTTINDSDLWQHLIETQYFSDLNEDIETVNNFLDSNIVADMLLKDRKLIIAGVMSTPKKWDFLFAVDLEEEGGTIKSLNKAIDLIAGFKITRTELKINGKHEIIQMTSKSDPEMNIFLTFADNIILVSLDAAVIEKSLKQLSDNYWQQNARFVQISEQIPQRKLFKIYINYDNIDDFAGIFLTTEEKTISMFANSLAYSVMNLDITSDKIILDGYANLDSLGSYIHALAWVAPGKMSAYHVLSSQAAAYISITFDNYYNFYNNLMTEYKKNSPDEANDIIKSMDFLKNVIKIDVENDLFSWIGNEIAISKIRPLSDASRQEDVTLLIQANDIEKAKNGMENIVDQIRKWSPFKFKEYNYKNFNISYLKQKNFFKPFLGLFFDEMEEPYYTFIEDFVVFSNSQEVLHQLIDDYIAGRTLSKDNKFQSFIDEFNTKSTMAAFINMPKMYPTLYYYTPAQKRQDLKENQELIMSITRVGFQLVSKGEMFATTLIAQYDANAYYEDLTEKIENETQNDIFTRYIDTMGYEIILDNEYPDTNYVKYFDGSIDKIELEGKIKDNKPDGLWRSYYPNENIKSAITYKEGETNGVAYFYYNDNENTLRAEVTFEDNKVIETFTEYYDNGARKANILYDDGQKDGDAEFYYRTGNIKIKGKYKDNKKNGKWIFYSQKGEKITTEKWKNGNKK